jgi:hypothetical protein
MYFILKTILYYYFIKKVMKVFFIYLVFGTFMLLQSCTNSKTPEQVLFIGNSITYFHDMPQMVQRMLFETDSSILISQSVSPGAALNDLMNYMFIKSDIDSNKVSCRNKRDDEYTELEKMLIKQKWDRVILQEEPGHVFLDTVQAIQTSKIISRIKEMNKNKECSYFLYQPFLVTINKPGKFCFSGFEISDSIDRFRKYCSKEFKDKNELDNLGNAQYKKLADENELIFCNMNLYEKVFKKIDASLLLVDETGHPTKMGSFVIACKFYKLFTGRNVKEVKYNGGLNNDVATIIKNTIEKG